MNDFRGEFQVELEGKTYQVLMTLNALRMLTRAEGIKLEELEQFLSEDPLTAMCSMTYWGAKNASVRKKQDLPSFDLWCAMCLDNMESFTKLSANVMESLSPQDEEEDTAEGNE